MAGAKEIRSQIRSIRNTQKITKAMEMVAASKMRRALDRMNAGRPYAAKMRDILGNLAQATPDYQHPFLVERSTVKRVGYIIVSTDRGLCGGLNINLFKQAVLSLRTWNDQGVEADICLFGNKASQFFRRFGFNIVSQETGLGDKPELTRLIGAITVMLSAYESGQIDRLYLVSNNFVNTMTQKPEVRQLLPVQHEHIQLKGHRWDYIYEPSAESLIGNILTRYVESQIYQSVAENIACEMAARMVAMKSATDNAGQIIDGLSLAYNKARQAAITQELAEITAGAAAVS